MKQSNGYILDTTGNNILTTTENGATETVIYTYQDNNSLHQFQLG